jgi:hypothetical protein
VETFGWILLCTSSPFSDYWVQHNVHRILFPKLLMFPLAKLTSWNHGYERIDITTLTAGLIILFST